MSIKQRVVTSTVCSVMALLAVVFDKEPVLKTSPQGLTHIAEMEGCRLKAYQCSADKWTAGAGHTEGVKPDSQITILQAADYFIQDVTKAEQVVNRAITHKPTQGEYDMMVSFVFHLGAGNFKRSTLLKQFNTELNTQACNQYPRWVYVDDKDCRIEENDCEGIVTRRAIEQNVCLYGWDSPKTRGLYAYQN
ncbi:lysozyme [Vibrio scophthalmi]|uniref:Lysozyme n=1 Tax=Vibrio scophthalmi TaxID=45658 RepID=A0A1C7F8L2_9VIBR|nr:lysozyme [Vibrio scophthalmi]ANU36282.1 Lysozyme [Vibrio scophthalmi]